VPLPVTPENVMADLTLISQLKSEIEKDTPLDPAMELVNLYRLIVRNIRQKIALERTLSDDPEVLALLKDAETNLEEALAYAHLLEEQARVGRALAEQLQMQKTKEAEELFARGLSEENSLLERCGEKFKDVREKFQDRLNKSESIVDRAKAILDYGVDAAGAGKDCLKDTKETGAKFLRDILP
jgi:hypothetical protein